MCTECYSKRGQISLGISNMRPKPKGEGVAASLGEVSDDRMTSCEVGRVSILASAWVCETLETVKWIPLFFTCIKGYAQQICQGMTAPGTGC